MPAVLQLLCAAAKKIRMITYCCRCRFRPRIRFLRECGSDLQSIQDYIGT